MKSAYLVEEIRAGEAAAARAVAPGVLMMRASRAIAVHAAAMLGFSYGARVVLLVGAGDNGGDALFAGASLAGRGVAVKAVAVDLSRVHAEGSAALRAAGGRFVGWDEVGEHDLIVDGLVGIGASGALREPMWPLVRFATTSAAPVLAVDIPSGVDPETGAVTGPAITATRTVCLGALKPGVLVGEGRLHAGRIELVDIGVRPSASGPFRLLQLEREDVRSLVAVPGARDDKYTRGVVGVAAGSAQYPGAAQLTVGAAILGGAGVVRYAGHAAAEVGRSWPQVLVSDSVPEADRVQAWVVGPGLGRTKEASDSLRLVLAADVPVLVDADGLNLLVDQRSLLGARTQPTLLTPHDREFERLFGEVGSDRLGAVRRAADESGAVVLLKGFATIVAEPGGRCFVNPTGSPWLATAGSGDVLSGLTGSLMATGLEPVLAGAVGSYLHGLAAQRAATDGPITATDLIGNLAAVIGEL